jgi:hypothetical protein
MKPEGSLVYRAHYATGTYPKPDESSPYSHALFP